MVVLMMAMRMMDDASGDGGDDGDDDDDIGDDDDYDDGGDGHDDGDDQTRGGRREESFVIWQKTSLHVPTGSTSCIISVLSDFHHVIIICFEAVNAQYLLYIRTRFQRSWS